jgi:hypothetical protein
MLDVDEKCPDTDQTLTDALIITPFPYLGHKMTMFECVKA